MRPFLATKRKLLDLIVLLILGIAVFFLQGFDATFLFSFGFIWNWSASQDLSRLMEGKSYQYTMLKLVLSSQALIVSPAFVQRSPEIVKLILRSLPAGLFWWGVMWFMGSELPFWATFMGSFAFEISQWEVLFRKQS